MQSHVPRHVADAVGADLGRAEPIEETHRKEVAHERDGAAVVRIQDGLRPGARDDPLEPLSDRGERDIPSHMLETALALAAHAAKRPSEARVGVQPLVVVTNRTFGAELALAHEMAGLAANRLDRAVALVNRNSAGVVAIARAR